MANVQQITLAGKRYAIMGAVQKVPIEDMAQQWRMGAPDYSDRQGAQYWEWDDLSGGVGLDIINTKTAEHRRRTYLEYRVDSRWAGAVTIGPLLKYDGDIIPGPSLPQYGRFLDIPGAMLFVSQATSWPAAIWRNAATTWNQVFGATGASVNLGRAWKFPVPNDIEQDIYLGTGGGLFRSPINGLSWSYCLATPAAAFPARGLGYDLSNDTFLIQKTKDDGKLYTVSGHPPLPAATAIGYLGGLVGEMVTFYDEDGTLVPYISVFNAPSGDNAGKPLASLYRVDLLEEKVYPVSDAPPAINAPASGQTWQNIVVWNGWLYMILGSQLYRYQPGRWETVPLSKETFVLWGTATVTLTGIAASANWLYINAQLSATDGYLFAVGPDGDWHGIARQGGPTALAISDNWTPNRLYNYRINGNAPYYYELPQGSDNPLETATYSYQESGVLDLPWFDGGFAEIEGTALRVTVVADALSATETVAVAYRTVKGAAFTTLGTINSTTSSLDFASGVGLAFKIIQFRITLARGSTTTVTPIIRRIVFTYLKKQPVRYRYTINIKTPGTITGLRSMETILGEIETAYNATTLRELKYGRVTANVNIVSYGSIEEPPANAKGQRKVYQMQVVMEEPI